MNKLVAALAALLLGTILSTAGCANAGEPHRAAVGTAVPRIFTAGDSITAGGPPWAPQETSYPEALAAACGNECQVTNLGHPGACLLLDGCFYPTRLRESLREQAWPGARPGDIAVVMIGANDLGGFNTTDAYVDRLRDIRRDGRKAGVRVVFGTITPAHEFWPPRCEEQRQEINAWIRQQPGSIDFASVLESSTGELRARYDSGDGLHPNSRAYRAMGRYAWKALAA
ncbi:SGNH/GDSL hydrolase family protein [Nocardioides sp.]|uniref:SGNH/GDSL hydrolase family protein n=1 Tax=Nocardioides sp. TaxID=35761 RepID=UPI0035AF83E7